MLHTLTKTFIFEAAHTLKREIACEGSRRIHGHTYTAKVGLRGYPDSVTGMLIDLGKVDQLLQSVRAQLDHHFLDEVENLGPATLENLCSYIWRELSDTLPQLFRVSVERGVSGDACSLTREAAQ